MKREDDGDLEFCWQDLKSHVETAALKLNTHMDSFKYLNST